jgi:GNAT superfamily N-acetyltransferase
MSDPPKVPLMTPIIRPARSGEYDEVARVWLNSWASTGIEAASDALLEKMRSRIRAQAAKDWSLYVADDGGMIAAILALRLSDGCLGQLFIAPDYQGQGLGKQLLAFAREQMPKETWLRCVRENNKAWRWYEREGFVFEKEEANPMTGFMVKFYRWKKEGIAR